MAELLVAKGADANARDGRGLTPLHCAAYHGNKGLAEALLARN